MNDDATQPIERRISPWRDLVDVVYSRMEAAAPAAVEPPAQAVADRKPPVPLRVRR